MPLVRSLCRWLPMRLDEKDRRILEILQRRRSTSQARTRAAEVRQAETPAPVLVLVSLPGALPPTSRDAAMPARTAVGVAVDLRECPD